MIRKILFAGFIIMLASCKGGNKGPVMASQEDTKVMLNKDASEHVANVPTSKKDVDVKHEDGILSIADVFERREELAGTQISVKGEVTKYNPAIMSKNWVHIQDGTEYKGEFDLTITTPDAVEVGKQVVFTGVLAIDRDFGYGYTYSTILESAVLKK